MITFLPTVHNETTVSGQGNAWQELTGQLFVLMVADAKQQRRKCIWNDTLARAAQHKAEDMVRRRYYHHTDPEGQGPNDLVRRFGYRLPDYYGKGDANNIESFGLNYKTPERCWQGWLGSPGHKQHVLGEIDFYRQQVCVGIGYAEGSDRAGYPKMWILISAPEES